MLNTLYKYNTTQDTTFSVEYDSDSKRRGKQLEKKSICKMETKRLKIKEIQNTKNATYRRVNHIRQ